MFVIENENKEINNEYINLLKEVREELPNIVLPSMGMLDDVGQVNLNGKDYIISDDVKEE